MELDKGGKIPRGKRLAVLFSIVAYVVFFGVPFWWYSTRINRPSLPPYQHQISHLNISNIHPLFIVHIQDHNEILPENLVQHLQALYEYYIQFEIQNENKNQSPQLRFVIIKDDSLKNIKIGIKQKMQVVEVAFPSSLKNEEISQYFQIILKAFFDPLIKISKRNMLILYQTLLIQFSLCNADPKNGYWTWNFPQLKHYLEHFIVQDLKQLINIKFEQQVLFHTQARVKGKWNTDENKYIVTQQQLPFFIDSEWPLDSGVQANQEWVIPPHVLNFIVYIPHLNQRPLSIYSNAINKLNKEKFGSKSYIVPGWGGLVITNPPTHNLTTKQAQILNSGELEKIAIEFCNQMRALLSLPSMSDMENFLNFNEINTKLLNSTNDFSQFDNGYKFKIIVEGIQTGRIQFWEKDWLMNVGTVKNIQNALTTLNSLVKLVSDLSNLAMPDSIKDHVEESVNIIKEVFVSFSQARNLSEVYWMSRRANYHAEAAFGHPAILSQLNVSFQHKAAIYVPFFMPLSIPVFFKFGKELVRYIRRRQAALAYRQQQKQEKKE
eukprot:TRINITY_DN19156_c0_g1_i10.p1 TRINITY_DN19156_c0_g1~~TRINITY_DN19156_c0_g1_i10.p1  ORF type:complete len:549 (+),score=25.08 TRINITY_DN19156_c0_g1_i10:120-1766(+)